MVCAAFNFYVLNVFVRLVSEFFQFFNEVQSIVNGVNDAIEYYGMQELVKEGQVPSAKPL